MQTFAVVALLFVGVVVLVQLANGTMGQWLRSKFLGRPGSGTGQSPTAATKPQPAAAKAAGS